MWSMPLSLWIEIIALVVSIIFFKRLWETKLKWFPFFLAFVVAVEQYGNYLFAYLHQPNIWLYNLSIPIEYLFYFYILNIHITQRSGKQLSKILAVVFIFIAIVYNVTRGLSQFNTTVLLAGNIFVIILVCFWFIELFNREEQIHLIREPIFWIASGFFLFNAGESLYSMFYPVLKENGWDRGAKLFREINNKLILVLYLSYIIAFICLKFSYRYRTLSDR